MTMKPDEQFALESALRPRLSPTGHNSIEKNLRKKVGFGADELKLDDDEEKLREKKERQRILAEH